MNISLLKDYNLFDAGSKPAIEKIVSKIQITENQITIDLSRCIIDYPATSLLFDKILNDLTKLPSPRILVIQTHLDILELLLLHWLFIGSKFFKIDSSQRKNQLDEFKMQINNQLNASHIAMSIHILDKKNELLRLYNYGQ